MFRGSSHRGNDLSLEDLVDVTEALSVTSTKTHEGEMLMADQDRTIRIDEEAARGAVSNTGLRYVLGFSLGLAVVAMSLVWIIPALYNVNH
jgi:hypothetical protein